jgi:alpha-L-fucosidase
VLTAKQLSHYQRYGIVEDVERGFLDEIRPQPWQTSTCIGSWHYDRPLFERHGYKPARLVVQRLCDIVSKNGNLLLSVPLRGDGSLDEDEVAILEALARWFAVNGEAIYGTRPWRIYGEGPTRPRPGFMNEGRRAAVQRPGHPLHDQGGSAARAVSRLAGRRSSDHFARLERIARSTDRAGRTDRPRPARMPLRRRRAALPVAAAGRRRLHSGRANLSGSGLV